MLIVNQDQETEEKEIFTTKPWKVFIIEAFLFCITLLVGIATAFEMNRISQIQKLKVPEISFWYFIFSFTVATLFIFLLIKLLKFNKQKKIVFKTIFTLAVFLGGTLLLSVWIQGAAPLFLMGILIFWWWTKPSILIQDLCVVLGIAGTGSFLGLSLSPEVVVILLIIFSIYDFIAVYKTKHMIKMAKEMIESKAILALVVPPDIAGFKRHLGRVKPGGKFLVLGGGDIVFPLLFASSLVPYGILDSLIVAIFSLFGLAAGFLFFVSQKKRRPIPALPPIALFSIIGFLITKIF